MSWLRVDDGFPDHPKVAELTDREFRRWVETLCYCARFRTGGEITRRQLLGLGVTGSQLARLVRLRLLDPLDQEGTAYLVHDFDIYNGRPDTGDLEQQIGAILAAQPDASANQIVRATGGRRSEVLDLVKRLRTTESTGSQQVPALVPGTGTEPVRARAGARVPHPLPLTTPAAALDTPGPEPARDRPEAAAAIRARLDDLGITHTVADDDLSRAQAWLDLAATEAKSNPAGYVLTGLRSASWPSARVARAHASAGNGVDPSERARSLITNLGANVYDPITLDVELDALGVPAAAREELHAYADSLRVEA